MSGPSSHLFTPAVPQAAAGPPPVPPPAAAAPAAPDASVVVSRLTHLAEAHLSSPHLLKAALFLSSLLHSLLLSRSPNPASSSASSSAAAPVEGQGQAADHTGRLLYARALLAAGQPASALHLVQHAAVGSGEPALVGLAQEACLAMGRWREGAWLGEVGRKAREKKPGGGGSASSAPPSLAGTSRVLCLRTIHRLAG